MTYEIRGLKAKLTRRNKRIADLKEENLEARKLLKDAINSARMIARENAMLKANLDRGIRNRTAQLLSEAEYFLGAVRNVVASYETSTRRKL